MASLKCPEQWSEWNEWLAARLHARNRWRLPVLLTFAGGRHTTATWPRAARVSDDFQDYCYLLARVKRKSESLATQPRAPRPRARLKKRSFQGGRKTGGFPLVLESAQNLHENVNICILFGHVIC